MRFARAEGVGVVKTIDIVRAAGFAACVALVLPIPYLNVTSAAAASSSAKATKTASNALASTAPVDVKEPQGTPSVTAADDDKCLRSRKRLWVEGEGWVVRRVTTCF
jgi:hypothetical protein